MALSLIYGTIKPQKDGHQSITQGAAEQRSMDLAALKRVQGSSAKTCEVDWRRIDSSGVNRTSLITHKKECELR